MPAPSSTTFQRPDLGQSFEEFDLAASMQGFIGLQVLPIFNVSLQGANFSRVPVEALLQERDTTRASGGGYSRQDWEFEQDSYLTTEHGAEEVMDDRERKIYAYTIDFDRIAAMRAMDAVLRNLEKRIAAAVFNTSTFNNSAVGTAWDVYASATPLDDVVTATNLFKAQSGMMPNAVIVNDVTMRNLARCDQLIDQLKYSGIDDPKKITPQMIAALFNVDRLIVPNTMRNSSPQVTGSQAITFANIWGNTNCMLAKIATSQDLKEPCLGRTFHWTGDGSSEGGTVEQYRDERVRADIMRARIDVQEKILYTVCGYILTGVASS